jgi:hypothetical protein
MGREIATVKKKWVTMMKPVMIHLAKLFLWGRESPRGIIDHWTKECYGKCPRVYFMPNNTLPSEELLYRWIKDEYNTKNKIKKVIEQAYRDENDNAFDFDDDDVQLFERMLEEYWAFSSKLYSSSPGGKVDKRKITKFVDELRTKEEGGNYNAQKR